MAVDFDNLTDEQYFGELKMMFATDGWEILYEELLGLARTINDVQDVSDQRDLDYKRGQLAAYGRLLNFEDTILRAEAEANEVDEEEEE